MTCEALKAVNEVGSLNSQWFLFENLSSDVSGNQFTQVAQLVLAGVCIHIHIYTYTYTYSHFNMLTDVVYFMVLIQQLKHPI